MRPERFSSFRMDFEFEVLDVDEDAGKISVCMRPDPRRYEWQEIDGQKYLYDKLDETLFPIQILEDAAQRLEGGPINFQPAMIEDADEYLQSRKSSVTRMLQGFQVQATFEDKSEEFLESLAENKLRFVILSIDVVNSTQLAATIGDERYAQLITTILHELSEITVKFRGHVLKYTGDGLIAYFAEPSFITKHDLAIDGAITMLKLVYEVVKPACDECGLLPVDARIGLESGEAYIETVGSNLTKQQKDIIGVVVSLSSKIQEQAHPGEIYLGETMLRHLHVQWRQHCKPIELGEDWRYEDPDGDTYRVYRMNLKPW